jgi:integrase
VSDLLKEAAPTTAAPQVRDSGTLPDQGQRTSEQGDVLARRRYQKGSVQRRGENWIGRWREDYIGNDGSTHRIRRSQVIGTREEFPTKKLARRQLDVILARINALDYRPGRVASLEQFVARWQHQAGSLRKPSTAKSQASHLRYHIVPALGSKRLDELTLEAQQAFVARLAKSLKRKTLLNVLQTLSVVLNTAKSWGYVTEGMSIKRLTLPPRGAHAVARFFSAEEARRIITAAREPYATIYAVAAMTGMRAGELLGLKVSDIDFTQNLILVQRSLWNGQLQAPKSQTSVRAIPIPESLARRLARFVSRWTPNPLELLFATRRGTPIDASKLTQRKLQPLLKKVGIPKAGLHAFRHTCASLLVSQGASPRIAQQQLGHSDPRITLAVYSHVIGDSHRQAVEKLASVFGSLDADGPMVEANGTMIQ